MGTMPKLVTGWPDSSRLMSNSDLTSRCNRSLLFMATSTISTSMSELLSGKSSITSSKLEMTLPSGVCKSWKSMAVKSSRICSKATCSVMSW